MYRSEQPQRRVYDSGPALETEPAFLEHPQHRDVVWQDLRDQLPEPGTAGDRGEVAHQGRADTLPLVLVDDGESHLRRPGLDDDVASAPDDHRPSALVRHRDQGHVIGEVDI